MFDVGEDIFHGSRDDTRLVLVSRLEREGESQHRSKPSWEEVRIELTKVNVFPEAVCP